MLFGRRKPGFVQVENESSEKEEELKEIKSNEKPDLLEFLSSLPDDEDEFENNAYGDSAIGEEELKEENDSEARKLAEYIRKRSVGATLTKLSSLKEEIENAEELLKEIEEDETCQDILFKDGKKDRYYYSTIHMSNNYAMIASLIEDKDMTATIAEMVRFNCNTYPTPITYFERHPYYATRPQIERAIALMSGKEEYADIQRLTNNRNKDFLYSTKFMSFKYANALAREEDFTD